MKTSQDHITYESIVKYVEVRRKLVSLMFSSAFTTTRQESKMLITVSLYSLPFALGKLV